MPTMIFGRKSLSLSRPHSGSHQGTGFRNCGFVYRFVSVCILSADIFPSIHADPEYPCELVGTWNTWYGEQDQAGERINEFWV